MAIPTTRTKDRASVSIDADKCTGCGNCVDVCKDFGLEIRDDKAVLSNNPLFGCVACGHCMAVCPTGAITVTGRFLSREDLFSLPAKENAAGYSELLHLLQRRRSIREFADREVEIDVVNQIIDAATTAPMGIPPSDVNVNVWLGKEKSKAFAADFSAYLSGMKYMTSPLFLTLMRPFWGKANDEMFRAFVSPLFRVFTEEFAQGNNYINYDAPLLMYFYGSPYTDPADPIVAATYAMIAGESLGLGSCMLGAVHPFIQNGSKAAAFRKKHHIKYKSREGIFVAFGYPAVKYGKGLKRSFACVHIS